jgi:two-component system cell cycle sensor histidine kinase/response regulator CckA
MPARPLTESALLFLGCVAAGALSTFVPASVAPPAHAWPAVGIGAVAVALRGRRVLPATFAAVACLLMADATELGRTGVAVLALASTAQAVAGRWLLRRLLGPDLAVVTVRQVVTFQLVTGPLHLPLAAAAWAALRFRADPNADAAADAFNWWCGDAAGGVLTAPLALVALGVPRLVSWSRAVTVAVPLVLCVGGAAVSLRLTEAHEGRIIRRAFDRDMTAAATAFAAGAEPVEVAARRLQHAGKLPTDRPRDWPAGARERLREFTEYVPAARAVAVAHLTEAERAAFEAGPTAEGTRPPVVVRDGGGGFAPAPPRMSYDVVTAANPPTPKYPVGLDIAADPAWAGPIADALWAQRLVVAEPIDGETLRFVVPCLDGRGSGGECVAIEWDTAGLLSRCAGGVPGGLGLELAAPRVGDGGVPIAALGKSLVLRGTLTPAYAAAQRPGAVSTVALAAVLLAFALANILLLATGRTALVAREVEERTRELRREVRSREDVERFLRQSEQWLTDAQRIARVGYWEWRPDADELVWSTVMAELLGLQGSDVRLRLDDFLDRVYPAVRRLVEGMPGTAHAIEAEFRVVRNDGTVRWFTSTVTGGAGSPDLIRGTALDVTDRKRAEVALREGEARLRMALHSARMGTWEWVIGTDDLYWDLRQEAIFGFPPGGFNRTLAAFRGRVHPDDAGPLFAELERFPANRSNLTTEFRIVLPAGEVRWIAAYGQVFAAEGRRPRLVGINYDITERKRAEERLLGATERLNEAQEIARVGSFDWAVDGKDVYWSDEMFRLIGHDPDSVPPNYQTFLGRVHPDDHAVVAENYRAAVRDGTPYCHELRVILPSGEVRHLLATARVATDARGRVTHVRGTNHDVTEQVREAEERRRFQERLTESQRLESLGVLAGGVAHDFNNLLTGILGNASLARELLPPDSELHEYLRPVEKSAEHAAHLCLQMLTYAGERRPTRGTLDLDAVVQDSDDLLKLSVSRRADFRLELHQFLPPVEGDAGQLRQVLLNLVQNASEALPEAGGRVTVRTGHDDPYPPPPDADTTVFGPSPDCAAVWLEVSDTGHGMAEATRQRIFEPFFTTKFTGRGLGLSAVVGIVRAHGGCLSVTSRPGEGSTFRVAIPCAAGASTVDGSAGDRTPTRIAWNSAVRRTALVADDDPTVAAVVGYALKGLGFALDTAATGAEATARFVADPGRYDLAVLDLVMPDGDGRDVLRAVRARRPGMPVILISGYTEQQVDDLEFNDTLAFLHKPFRAVDLTAVVRRILTRTAVAG